MSANKNLKENIRHVYGKYDLDENEDIVEVTHCTKSIDLVHKEHAEVYDPDAFEEERDIGVNKRNWEINQSWGEATTEDFNVNKGGTSRNNDRIPDSFRDFLDKMSFEFDETEDDDE